jgi:hypothetical protein
VFEATEGNFSFSSTCNHRKRKTCIEEITLFLIGYKISPRDTLLCETLDLGIPTIREEIKNSSKKYKDTLQTHPNDLATNLFDDEGEVRRLKKFKPSDLSTRFD